MDPAVWTLIALLAGAELGSVYYPGTKIDARAAELGARIDAQRIELKAEIAALGARIDAQTARIDDHLGRHAD